MYDARLVVSYKSTIWLKWSSYNSYRDLWESRPNDKIMSLVNNSTFFIPIIHAHFELL